MKHVNRINQFLLKNYPLVWNTRLFWLLLLGTIVHTFFFVLGFSNLRDPLSLQGYNVINNFFNEGALLMSMLISTILIVGWLFFMFKNNSFKSFYPTSRTQLFSQFVIYFFIIIFNTTYYYSFTYGMKLFVKLNYPSHIVDQDIALANKAAPFFSHHLNQYEINQKGYPKLLRNLHCETNNEFINLDKPYFKFLEEYYQFYSLKKVKINRIKRRYRDNEGEVRIERLNDSMDIYYYKDTVVDVSEIIKTAVPSYYNYSTIFFNYIENYNDYYYYNERSNSRKVGYDSTIIQFVESHNSLLDKNDSDEIKKLLDDFLQIADRYKISTNLKTADWFHLINTDSFQLKSLIKNRAPIYENQADYGYRDWDRKKRNNARVEDENGNRIKTAREEFIDKIRTDFYMATPNLSVAFSNLKRVKNTNPFVATIHFFLWFSFFLASLIFIYRIAGLRSFIFSILTFGVLSLILTLIALSYNFIFKNNFINVEDFMAVFTWMVGTAILCIPIFYLKRTNKTISSIFINISLSCFAIYMALIVVIISLVQENYFNWKYQSDAVKRYNCETILDSVGIYWSYIFFVAAFIFIYFITSIIRSWRALPESK